MMQLHRARMPDLEALKAEFAGVSADIFDEPRLWYAVHTCCWTTNPDDVRADYHPGSRIPTCPG